MANRNQGFTFIDVVITVSVLAVISAIAMSAINDFIERSRQQALFFQLQDTIQNARAKAVLRRQTVVLCGTRNMDTCSNDWRDGWLTKLETTGQKLALTQLTGAKELRWIGFGNQQIRFYENGTSPWSNGRFYQCYKQRIAWQLILSRQGRLRQGTAEENESKAALCSP
ncbi:MULTISPECIES: GspH/FimT family pseudopilin [Stutzerimonas stutzeri subgroup]|uniref:Type II secretion system protein H n=1 Tax=Stutzerimonas stutzeri CCUG 29243 TaxID=1196835 RepID=I4CWZ6_STUST|nr:MULTISPECIES: GspH/FimT family pseudopilin [Stutzerimonas stutzeri subgroup]AFM34603.1 type 4 fimbrial biogenesis protein FimT [Stutzerimonas stutzeri CCUG 29243]MCQ2036862.1 GspH/FimT family pseudopilin [Stutzerimonas kunmingensis]